MKAFEVKKRLANSAVILLVFLVLISCVSAPGRESTTIRIVFLGDSITSGVISRGDDGGYTFRYWLWKMLIDAHMDFDFVGSQDYSPGPDYQGHTFDRDHEGHWGWTTERIRIELPGWLKDYDADLAVIHIGHNDMRGNVSNPSIGYNATDANIREIVHQLQKDNRNITIMLALIIPASDIRSDLPPDHIDSVNALLDDIAVEEATRKSKILIVDLHSQFNAEAWTHDGVHPNALGEKFMAQGLFDAFVEHGIVNKSK